MWAQTTRHVYVAIMLPTGYKDKELHMDFRGQVFGSKRGSPPVVEDTSRFNRRASFRANHANGG